MAASVPKNENTRFLLSCYYYYYYCTLPQTNTNHHLSLLFIRPTSIIIHNNIVIMLSVRILSLDVRSSTTAAAGDGVRCAVQVVHGSQRYRTRLVEPTRTMPQVVEDNNKVNDDCYYRVAGVLLLRIIIAFHK